MEKLFIFCRHFLVVNGFAFLLIACGGGSASTGTDNSNFSEVVQICKSIETCNVSFSGVEVRDWNLFVLSFNENLESQDEPNLGFFKCGSRIQERVLQELSSEMRELDASEVYEIMDQLLDLSTCLPKSNYQDVLKNWVIETAKDQGVTLKFEN